METSTIYVLISIIALLIIAVLLIFVRKEKKKKILTPLSGISYAFVLAGILFGDGNLIGYSLIGVGVLLAVIDIFKKFKANKRK
ncbi:MAG: hypothetical protein NTU63_00015 [Candidatus Pacearchaeota archaeon]|nr:hypothetical protein [Candidatus Pacearchaeota archaeon]